MNHTVFVSIVSEEYLGYYNVLYQSLKKHAPDYTQILYYIGNDGATLPFDNVVDLNKDYDETNPVYDKLTKICSLRARVVLDAFDRGYDNVVFTGAKVEFFDTPFKLYDPFNAIQDPFNAVVTPHILEPLPEDGRNPSNAGVSFTGHISTDVVSFRDCPEIRRFLTWQDELMKTKCQTTDKTYLDQSWLNFLPFLVPGVKILRDPAYNVAYWNIVQRLFNKNDDIKWTVYDKEKSIVRNLVCFQYSGLDLNNPQKISTHQNRHSATEKFLDFLEDYIKRVKEFKK